MRENVGSFEGGFAFDSLGRYDNSRDLLAVYVVKRMHNR